MSRRKKNASVQAAIQRRLELERWEHRLQEGARVAQRRAARTRSVARPTGERNKASTGKRHPETLRVNVPQRLDLNTDHAATCAFVDQVRETVKRGHVVCLVFDELKELGLSALIYLLAQIHKLRMQYGSGKLIGTYPKEARIERLLTESGFFELLGVKSRQVGSSRTNRYMRFRSDQKINGAQITGLRDELLQEDLRMPPAIGRAVFRALSEAMTNVNHHAYQTKHFATNTIGQQLRGRWWLFATLNVPNNRFVLSFYDSGVGIPKTLPRKYGWELIREVFSLLPGLLPDDGQMIEAAMTLGRSRTNLGNRGKGLLDLARLIDVIGAGRMNIFSRQGCYSYTPSEQSANNSAGFLEGTLIEWRLPIDRALQDLPRSLYEPE